jgi:hypothetical protein
MMLSRFCLFVPAKNLSKPISARITPNYFYELALSHTVLRTILPRTRLCIQVLHKRLLYHTMRL